MRAYLIFFLCIIAKFVNLWDLKARLGVGNELLDVVVLLLHVRAELLVLLVQPLHLGWRMVNMLNLLLLLLLLPLPQRWHSCS